MWDQYLYVVIILHKVSISTHLNPFFLRENARKGKNIIKGIEIYNS